MLKYRISWFDDLDFSWFVIFIVTFHSLGDTLGRYIGAMEFNKRWLPKSVFPLACLSRMVFVLVYLLTYKGVAP